jgi:ubiquinone/menaquinone biosynthesis C-methylase UbiE
MHSPTDTTTADTLRERKGRIAADFDRVAGGYDLLCTLNPGYNRHLRISAERLGAAPGARILDLCCGTGLSTQAVQRTCDGATITGLDASAGMLEVARAKPELSGVTWLEGNAMDPASVGATGPFDAIYMAYGIRNVVDPDLCLRRLHDLLAPGGALCLHEYSVADSRRSRAVWNLVTNTVVIPLGFAFTGTTTIFRYLRRSVLGFDGVRALEARLRAAGFVDVQTRPMDGWQSGIVHTFTGRKPE